MRATLYFILLLAISTSASNDGGSENSSPLSLRGSYAVVDFLDYVEENRKFSDNEMNFVDEGSCRGLGQSCLILSTCCSGRCQSPPTSKIVSLCVPQYEGVNSAGAESRQSSLLEVGSCRGLGRSCLISSVCCSGRCASQPITMICS